MSTLNLGVLDVAYSDSSGASGGAKTTGEIASILEAKYHVYEIFFETRKEKIAQWLAEVMADEIDDIVAGKKPSRDPLKDAMDKIQKEFNAFLDADEISKIFPPTQQIVAAQKGRNNRKKAKKNKGGVGRPAFIDTGQYQQSFRAWFTQRLSTE